MSRGYVEHGTPTKALVVVFKTGVAEPVGWKSVSSQSFIESDFGRSESFDLPLQEAVHSSTVMFVPGRLGLNNKARVVELSAKHPT